jgi:hypothetical protein
MKRPLGISILCFILLWLSVAGFLNGVFLFNKSNIFYLIFSIGGYLYGISALLTAISLWKMKSSSVYFFVSWAVILFIWLLFIQFFILRFPLLNLFAFIVIMSVILILVAKYIIKRTKLKNDGWEKQIIGK